MLDLEKYNQKYSGRVIKLYLSKVLHLAIDIKNISKSFTTKDKEFTALKNINLHVDDGELICLLGPSGCGKTTLLRLIGGLEEADEGEIYDREELVSGPSKDRGFIFQQYSLFPWLNVLDNVMFGLNLSVEKTKEFNSEFIKNE